MIGAIASGTFDTAIAIAQQAAQTLGVAALTAGGSSNSGSSTNSVGAVGEDQAQISGPGRLLGQLQQLQSQDPTKFQQLLTNISNQLTTAAQQTSGVQSQFLTDLASLLQSAASSGNLAALQQQHHAHQGQGVYNQQGQVTPASTLAAGGTTGDTSSGGTLQQLFANIATTIGQAVEG